MEPAKCTTALINYQPIYFPNDYLTSDVSSRSGQGETARERETSEERERERQPDGERETKDSERQRERRGGEGEKERKDITRNCQKEMNTVVTICTEMNE